MKTLLKGLRRLRKARGLSQGKLAEAAKLSSDTIKKHEQGVLIGISATTLDALATALNCDASELFLPDSTGVLVNPSAPQSVAR